MAVDQPISTPHQRQVWRIMKQGALANLKLEAEPMPELQPGQALVEVKAIGLNFADVFCCLGLYKAAPPGAFIPGLEFSGVVTQVHTGTQQQQQDAAQLGGTTAAAAAAAAAQTPLQPGDHVMGVTRFGAFASHVVLDTRYLRPVPDGWGFEEGASFAVQALTAAYGLLRLGDLRAACERRRTAGTGAGAAVLVQSAAGGVGQYAVAICDALGARVLGLVGSEGKVEAMKQLLEERRRGGDGTDTSVQVLARVRGKTAVREQLSAYLAAQGLDGFDIYFDSAAGDYLQPGFDALAPCGRYVVFGAGTFTPAPGVSLARDWRLLLPWNLVPALRLALSWVTRPRLDVLALPGVNKAALGFNLIYLYGQANLMSDLYDEIAALELPAPHVGLIEPWERLPQALEALQGGGTVGKVVVTL